jgi:AT-binding transcription factor 1
LRCNACDFDTNSPHKLQVHVTGQQHQVSSLLYLHLQRMEQQTKAARPSANVTFSCLLCDFGSNGKHVLMTHVRSIKHLQMEQVHQLRKRAEGNFQQTDISDIFQVSSEGKSSENEDDDDIAAERRHDADLEDDADAAPEVNGKQVPY